MVNSLGGSIKRFNELKIVEGMKAEEVYRVRQKPFLQLDGGNIMDYRIVKREAYTVIAKTRYFNFRY